MNTTAELFDDPRKRFSDFALRDYELKITYLSNHFQRMWTRFNYFVVVEAALLGGRTIFGDKQLTVWGIAFGLGLSLIWYVMGAQDRYLVQVYRRQIEDAADLIFDGLATVSSRRIAAVGQVPDPRHHIRGSIHAWRLDPISTTKLAALIPLVVTAAWAVMLVSTMGQPR